MGLAEGAVRRHTGRPAEAVDLPHRNAEQALRGPAPEVDDQDSDAIAAPTDEFRKKFEAYGEEVAYETYDDNWKPPEFLDAPLPRPGFVQRWVAVSTAGLDDTTNLSQRLAEGWRPRDPATCPADWRPPTISDGSFAGTIGVRGMVLMERPLKLHKQYIERVKGRTASQLSRVKDDLFATHSNNGPFKRPVMESNTRVTRGHHGHQAVAPADDDD